MSDKSNNATTEAELAKAKAVIAIYEGALKDVKKFEEAFKKHGSNFSGQCGEYTPTEIIDKALQAAQELDN